LPFALRSLLSPLLPLSPLSPFFGYVTRTLSGSAPVPETLFNANVRSGE
jgi:hypothetical protein